MKEGQKKLTVKQWMLVGGVAVVVVFAIILGCILLKGKDNQGDTEDTSFQTEESRVPVDETTRAELEEGFEKEILINKLVTSAEEEPNYLKKMNELRTYEVLSATEADGNYYVTICISVPDLYSVVKRMESSEGLTKEQMDAALTVAIEEASLIEKEVTVVFHNTEYGMEMEASEEFLDAYYGGIIKIREEFYEEMFGGMTDEE